MRCALLCAGAVLAATEARAAIGAEDERALQVLVLDFAAGSVDEETVLTAGELVTAELVRRPRLHVTSGEDLRRALELEAERVLAGCDQEGCAAEIAGALGAELVVFGRASQLGQLCVLHLSLYDSFANRTVARASVSFDRPEALLERVPGAVSELVDGELRRRFAGSVGFALPAAPLALLLGGAAAVFAGSILAVLAVGGGGALGFSQSAALAAAEATYRSPEATSQDKRAALDAASTASLALALTPWLTAFGVLSAASLATGGLSVGAAAGMLTWGALVE